MKGASDYQRQIVQEVINDLTKVIKTLGNIDHNFAFVEGCDLEYAVIYNCRDMLSSVQQELLSGGNE